MKCRRCKNKAVVDLKNHHTAFCEPCFLEFVERQVRRAIHEHDMMEKGERVLVCVSGGKDSLALWDLLSRLGYEAHGLHVDLGIDGYSTDSRIKVEQFAAQRGLPLKIVSLVDLQIPIPLVARRSRRPECSVCGIIKRHFFNKLAVEEGYRVVATGHNLDDEAGRLLGNLLHWQWEYLLKQRPVLEAVGDVLARKVEPLCRLTERETAAYAILRKIDYVIQECPMSRGATSLRYKEVLNILEDCMPGTKAIFYGGFLKEGQNLLKLCKQKQDKQASLAAADLTRCSLCGSASFMDPCNFCKLTSG
ncbi:MAG: tRNA 2-thiocytidine biosynthesis TtcA family protein [bacterium]